ncbi:carbohydrate ABC transporter permease [Streptomyces rugosispiralis]|uniref:Sugar ABC transporter permease n=1 Tax=Streptomyces rugosispiralis TaxID=2967341 RepID=A0ABT1UQC9_9ACTN|nr:sugar ABC transporter permease [Streptomyces rugosispiralis]MCQ8186973.1 sugar ABC transporter permease [Streptomyces rugosispiralis]
MATLNESRASEAAAAPATASAGGEAVHTPRRTNRARSSSGRRRWLGLVYLAPALLIYACVVLLPAGQGVNLSFYHWDGITAATWAGVENYTDFFTDPTLRQAVGHTLFFIVFFSFLPVVLGMTSAALTARKDTRGAGVYRWIIFLPQVLTPAVVAVVWKQIYAPDGPLNSVLSAFGLGGLTRGWLGDFAWALPALGLAGTWGAFGLCMVLFAAGAQNIPNELYDAARMDGAGPLREFFTVTLPGLRGQLAVALTLTLLGAIRVFDIVWLTTKGGPGTSTITPSVVLYKRAFSNPDVGAACAIGVVLAVVALIVSLAVVKLSEGDD